MHRFVFLLVSVNLLIFPAPAWLSLVVSICPSLFLPLSLFSRSASFTSYFSFAYLEKSSLPVFPSLRLSFLILHFLMLKESLSHFIGHFCFLGVCCNRTNFAVQQKNFLFRYEFIHWASCECVIRYGILS